MPAMQQNPTKLSSPSAWQSMIMQISAFMAASVLVRNALYADLHMHPCLHMGAQVQQQLLLEPALKFGHIVAQFLLCIWTVAMPVRFFFLFAMALAVSRCYLLSFVRDNVFMYMCTDDCLWQQYIQDGHPLSLSPCNCSLHACLNA
jgi:hypothetical protein